MDRRDLLQMIAGGAAASALPIPAFAEPATLSGVLAADASRGANGTVTRPPHFRVKIRTDDFGGALSLIDETVPPGAGPRLHVHYGVTEIFFVHTGEFLFEIGGVQSRAGPGDTVIGPRDVPHRWVNTGAADARLLFQFLPGARMDGFFEELNEGRGGHGLAASQARFLRFGMKIVGPSLGVDGKDKT